jgi:hypothetical protein
MSNDIIDRVIAQFVRIRHLDPKLTSDAAFWEYDPKWDEIRYEPDDAEREWDEVRDEQDSDELVPDQMDLMTLSDMDYWLMNTAPEDFQ